MAEIVTIKTGKAPVESVTVKLTPSEARDLAKAWRAQYPYYSSSVPRLLERAANGQTDILGMDPVNAYLKATFA